MADRKDLERGAPLAGETLLSASEALKIILASAGTVQAETLPLSQAWGRILAGAVRADRDLPPFPRVAMDGFAVRAADFSAGQAKLRIAGTIASGDAWDRGDLKAGSCLRIMTGAPLPPGADAVVQVEKSRLSESGDEVILEEPSIGEGLNVHPQGADARAGDILLSPGEVLGAGHIAVMASVGAARVTVSRAVRVAVLSTGREIVPPAESPLPFQIRNSNGPALRAYFCETPWVQAEEKGIVPDALDATEAAIDRALEQADVLILSGGVSAGEFDYVPQALENLGVRKGFHKVAMRPGMPLWFGKAPSGTLVFGLPGNPVSVLVTCREFVMPALRKLAGAREVLRPGVFVPAAARFAKRKGFTVFVLSNLVVEGERTGCVPVPYHGSGHFLAAAVSDGLAVVPPGKEVVEPGEMLEFHPWEWRRAW
jgi:molybdopterin molybdotransferase